MTTNRLIEKRLAEDYTFTNAKNPFQNRSESDFFKALNDAQIDSAGDVTNFLNQWSPKSDNSRITWKDYFNKRMAKGGVSAFTAKMSDGKTKIDGIDPTGKIMFKSEKDDSTYSITYNGKAIKEHRFLDWINNYLPFTSDQLDNLEKAVEVKKKQSDGTDTKINLAGYFGDRGIGNDTTGKSLWKTILMDPTTEKLEFNKATGKITIIKKPKAEVEEDEKEEKSSDKSADNKTNANGTAQYMFVNKDGKTFTENNFLTAYVRTRDTNQAAAKSLLSKYTVYKNGEKLPVQEYLKERDINLETLTLAEVARLTNMVSGEPNHDGPEKVSMSDKIKQLLRTFNTPVYDHRNRQMNLKDGNTMEKIIANPSDYFITMLGGKKVNIMELAKNLKSTGIITEKLSEDFTADEMTQSGIIYLGADIKSEDGLAEFNLDIDELGQIVITPESEGVSFVGASLLTRNDDNIFVSIDDETEQREPLIEISYTMTSSEDDYGYFASIDEIGQIIITPENDNSSFVTATIGDNLNVSADDEDVVLTEDVKSAVATAKEETENFTALNGEIEVLNSDEAELIKSALEMYYDNVEMVNELGKYKIIYSDNEPTLTEAVEDESDYPQWEISYKFADDITDDGKTESTTLGAPSAEDAYRYAEQYARMQSEENDAWKSAKVISLQLVNN